MSKKLDMNLEKEFKTVDLILKSDAETRGVDAFALSLIKAERQIRRIFTYLMFQFPCFNLKHWKGFRKVLSDDNKLYFDNFLKGINEIWPQKIETLIGKEYATLYKKIEEATGYRNKIFHGQLTNEKLKRSDLIDLVNNIKKWCNVVAIAAKKNFGYDGFGRNSYRKNSKKIYQDYKIQINSLDDYKSFLKKVGRK